MRNVERFLLALDLGEVAIAEFFDTTGDSRGDTTNFYRRPGFRADVLEAGLLFFLGLLDLLRAGRHIFLHFTDDRVGQIEELVTCCAFVTVYQVAVRAFDRLALLVLARFVFVVHVERDAVARNRDLFLDVFPRHDLDPVTLHWKDLAWQETHLAPFVSRPFVQLNDFFQTNRILVTRAWLEISKSTHV
ncbi:hypothetical protein D3C85_1334780 [compost metagenome]